MVNHPNRGWRGRWTVDLEKMTATHRDGWIFVFAENNDSPGSLAGRCVTQPAKLTDEDMQQAARISREAGEIFTEHRNGRR